MSDNGERTGETELKPRAPRWMKIVLVLSLMINAAVVGAIGSRAWKIHKYGHGYHAMHAIGVHSFLRQLPRERRKELREKFRRIRSELHEHGYSSMKPLRGFANALAASDYDQSKVEAAVRAFRLSHEERSAKRERYILELVDALSAEERKLLGEKMLERADRRARWHKRIGEWSGKN